MKRSLVAKFGLALMALLLVGQGCLPGGGGGAEGATTAPTTLTIWRVLDNEDAFDDIIGAYRASHPQVQISYRKLRLEEYEGELVRALAEGRGPDIFSIHNTWVGEYASLMAPAPETVTVLEPVATKGLQKKVTYEPTQKRIISVKQLKEQFVEQVWRDVVRGEEEEIYALPLSMDSLALYYNKDLLDEAGIPSPASNWEAFQTQVAALTQFDSVGRIVRSGTALGRSDNVERGVDVLQLLMLQNGTEFVDDRGRVTITEIPAALKETRTESPALTATKVYTDFATPTTEVYSWNDSFEGSFEAFTSGQTAYFFGYNYHLSYIRAAAPKLNFGIAPAPQIEGADTANLASYWVEGVATASKNQNYAWDFVNFAASEQQAKTYLDATGKPTAHRNLIEGQLEDEYTGVFAKQNLTARHWYTGGDVGVVEQALKGLIDAVLVSRETGAQALNILAKQIAQTY